MSEVLLLLVANPPNLANSSFGKKVKLECRPLILWVVLVLEGGGLRVDPSRDNAEQLSLQ